MSDHSVHGAALFVILLFHHCVSHFIITEISSASELLLAQSESQDNACILAKK